MGKSKPAVSVRSVFLFSFHEHDWDTGEYEGEEFLQRFLQESHNQNWELEKADSLDDYIDPEVTTVGEFRTLCEGAIAELEYPEGTLDAPFKKLTTKMQAEGWKFVSGTFAEFEGNHNDTELHVVLEKATPKPAKKPAAKKPVKKAPATKKVQAKKPKVAKKPAAKKKK